MHNHKILSFAVALLALTISACSSEPGTPPSTDKTTPAAVTNQATTENNKVENPAKTQPTIKISATCTAIMDTHCVVCHHATRICQKLGRKNTKGWKRTISNMIKHGAQLTPAEEEALLQCLDQQQQEIKEYCQ